ncbi:hypothetical protein Q4Q34_18285 [Flavivirga abyssicola]|uniref:hypothetical protein n=1 Tax=Flavivirga abyssicola TaxID=3063533 RepID=UPI0026DF7D74|nr:hypothetical protein [Flavivirga sp. MEBiC07777]WVK13169.1 hypothetical protein Q4Q34_18285 [Flavivirga sp. MEBiC07777]
MRDINEIDNIKRLFSQIDKSDKEDFFEKVAEEFDMVKSSVRSGWFSRFEIPMKYNVRKHLIVYMQNYISRKAKKSNKGGI